MMTHLTHLLLVLLVPQALALTIGTTLQDCLAVAALFNNTCTQAPAAPTTWGNFKAHSIFCPAGKTWQHQVCVSCSTDGTTGATLIRLQSTSIPPYCFASSTVTARPVDFEVEFNPPVSTAPASLTKFTSQRLFDTAVCSNQKLNSAAVFNKIYRRNTGLGV
jgi:hypothetical protein